MFPPRLAGDLGDATGARVASVGDAMFLTAPVFDIQRFSVHDGPGIRTLVFFKGCPLRCAWCSNPESQLEALQLMFYPEKCIGCQRCLSVCTSGASTLDGDGVVSYHRELCEACGDCSEACPAEARKMVGKLVDVDYVVREVEKDYLFYERSGGGVTFGGGEPTLYAGFVDAAATRCRQRAIHTAVETCGHAMWEAMDEATRHIDLVLFDVKHMDPQAHAYLCGEDNELILSNLERLCRMHRSEVIVRIPILPGINDDEANIEATAGFIATLGEAVTRTELLAYHRLGLKKYQRLERAYGLKDLEVPDEGHMNDLKEAMEAHGIKVKVG